MKRFFEIYQDYLWVLREYFIFFSDQTFSFSYVCSYVYYLSNIYILHNINIKNNYRSKKKLLFLFIYVYFIHEEMVIQKRKVLFKKSSL